MTMGVIVLGAAMGFYFVSADSEDAAGDRAEITRDLRVAMNRMDGEIRQAVAATVVSSQIIDLQTPLAPAGGGAKALAHVRYDCSVAGAGATYVCTRDTGPAYGGLSGVKTPILSSVNNTDIFSVGTGSTATNPSFVAIKLNASFKSQRNNDSVQDSQLQDGVTLRNLSTL